MRSTLQFEKDNFFHVNFAHRGLHDIDSGIPENSLAAFRAAREAGYGAELDVQLSKDGKVVVFHDDTLDRVCSVHGNVCDFSLAQLKEMSLLRTEERIPLFTEVLDVFNGGGPLIVELKSGKRNKELCEKTYEILKGYTGVYCIESFHPFIVKWFKDNAPEVFRGQLAQPLVKYPDTVSKLSAWLMAGCRLSFLNKPDFIAYENTQRPARVLAKRKKGTLLFAWTSRKPDVDQALNDAVIFEGYRPQLKY
ncbi:MAG: glycerophosphodiester phosphodiesterase [Lachnospiraceae bacterium]|nr:glycerophosphodiester phosphodiesterase [Lachnospiraceae bacterium]